MKQKGLNRDNCFSRDQAIRSRDFSKNSSPRESKHLKDYEHCPEDVVMTSTQAVGSDLNQAFFVRGSTQSVDSSAELSRIENEETKPRRTRQMYDNFIDEANSESLPRVLSGTDQHGALVEAEDEFVKLRQS